MKKLHFLALTMLSLFFGSTVIAQSPVTESTVEIGTGTDVDKGLPTDPYYNYTYSQSLFLQSEINKADERITAVRYYYNGNSTWTENTALYLGHSDKTSFADGNDWQAVTDLTKVFEGDFTVPAEEGWVEITLTTPFVYNNTQNLIVAFDNNSAAYHSGSDHFFCTSSTENLSITKSNDATNPDPTSPVEGSVITERPNIQLVFNSLPTGPEISVAEKALDYGFIASNSTVTKTLSVTNTGVTDLIITEIACENSAYTSTATFPATIAAGASTSFEITFTPATAGNYNSAITVANNTEETPSIAVTGKAYTPGSLVDGFEKDATYFELWTVGSNWGLKESTSSANSGNCYLKMAADEADTLITPLLTITAEDTLSFFAKKSTSDGTLNLIYSADKITWTALEDVEVPISYGMITSQLTGLAGDYYIGFVATKTIYLDDVLAPIIALEDNDLEAKNIAGPSIINQNEEATYTISIMNMGKLTASNYSVILVDAEDNELATTPGVSIQLLEKKDIELKWTPAASAVLQVKAKIVFAEDTNQENNETASLDVTVLDENIETVVIGDGTDLQYKTPVNYYYKSSLSESIFFADEITVDNGLISHLVYSKSFAKPVVNKPLRIWMANTDSTSFTNGWIPSTAMQLVFDGSINVDEGEGEMSITLNADAPFIYTGSNLAILVERPLDTEYIGSGQKFFTTTTEDKADRTIIYKSDTKPNNPAAPFDGSLTDEFANIKLLTNASVLGQVSGTVKDGNDALVADAIVEMVFPNATIKVTTNTEGTYSMPFALTGEQTLQANKFGFAQAEATVTISHETPATQDLILTALPKVAVSGHVIANDESGDIENATIKLTGYDDYEATSGADGKFAIADVYGNKTYTLTINAEGFAKLEQEVIVAEEAIDLGDIVLNEIPVAANMLTAAVEENAVKLNWNKPGAYPTADFRYDDGTAVGQLGFNNTDNSILGCVWNNKAQLSEISWYLTDNAAHETVNIYILGLQADGSPDMGQILYTKADVANTSAEWNTITLETPVLSENGFFVGINTTGFVSLGVDDGIDEPYVNQPGTMYGIFDHTSNSWIDLASQNIKKNFLLRAKGLDMGAIETAKTVAAIASKEVAKDFNLEFIASDKTVTKEPVSKINSNNSKSLVKYEAMRFKVGQATSEWVSLGNPTDTFYTDADWSTQEWGAYQYAVSAIYTHATSDTILSPVLYKDMNVAYVVNVTTNTDQTGEGAVAVLTNTADAEKVYTATADADGKISFPAVWRGTYNLTVNLQNYDEFTSADLDITAEGSSDAELIETLTVPQNLAVNIKNAVHTFSWNEQPAVYEENFDEFDDFALSFGEFTMIDGDDATTYGFQGIAFPNSGEKMASIIFNPSQTDPVMEQPEIQAHSGAKFAGFFCSSAAPNNDWLILPKQAISNNTVFNFFAKSFTAQYGLERFNVAVSTTGTTQADFTVISTGDYVEAPVEAWTEFSYELSAYAGQEAYIAIQCVSNDAFILMVDDLYVGPATSETNKSFTEYKVFLDDVEKTTTSETSFVFDNTDLVDGQEYTAGVQAIYSSGNSETATITFTADMTKQWTVTLNVPAQGAQDAAVKLSNATAPETIYNGTVNADGVAVLEDVIEGTYNLNITKEGFITYNEENIEVTADITKDIALQPVAAPVALSATVTNHDVKLNWLAPGSSAGTSESFEGEWTPAGWSTVVTNTTKSFEQAGVVSFSSGDITPQDGDYQAYCGWDYAHQDEWLITPEAAINNGDKLVFWTYASYDPANGDHYYVKASIDNGANWDILWDASAQPGGENKYDTPIELDLSAYAGQNTKLAWNCVDGDGQGLWHVFFIDNVTVGSADKAMKLNMKTMTFEPKELIGYNVYREGTKLNDEVLTETTYTDANLAVGVHNYTVTAVYDEGESAPAGPLAVQVGVASITVDHTSYAVQVEKNTTKSEQLTIGNEGEIDLTYSIAITYGSKNMPEMARVKSKAVTESWLSVDAATGTIAPDGDKDINVEFDGNGLEVGNYTATMTVTSNDPENATQTIAVTMGIFEGLNDLSNEGVMVYPNPANDIVNIKTTSNVELVRITTVDGREIYSATANNNEVRINTSTIEAGVYFIEINTLNGKMAQKLIVK